jgi:hypothetical protein
MITKTFTPESGVKVFVIIPAQPQRVRDGSGEMGNVGYYFLHGAGADHDSGDRGVVQGELQRRG